MTSPAALKDSILAAAIVGAAALVYEVHRF
jgi:hypothetical protein